MDNNKAKSAYQRVMDREYACALAYDKLSTAAYVVNALGLKRKLLKLSEKSMCNYKHLKHYGISIHEVGIVPNMKYVDALLMKVDEINVSPLSISADTFVEKVKKIMLTMKEWEKETLKILGEACKDLQLDHAFDYTMMTKMACKHTKAIKWLNKLESKYDKYQWDSCFIMENEQQVHDKIQRKK